MLAIAANAADRNSAETHTVIATLTPDEFRALRIAIRAVISQSHFQRGIDRLRTRIGKKHLVHAFRRDGSELTRGFKNFRMRHLEHRRIVQLMRHITNRLHNGFAPMPCIHTPQTRSAIENLPSIIGSVVHVFGRHEHARCGFELFIRRKWHPEMVGIKCHIESLCDGCLDWMRGTHNVFRPLYLPRHHTRKLA